MENVVKTIKNSIGEIGKGIIKRMQGIVFSLVLLTISGFFIYTLGYSTNWATIISSTRVPEYFEASQQANSYLFTIGFIGVIIVLLGFAVGTHKRKHYYISNIVLSIFSSIILIISAILTWMYNGYLEPMYRAITTDQVPTRLYESRNMVKSYFVFEFGNMYAIIMVVVSVLSIVYLIYKLMVQKDRKIQLSEAVKKYENG